MLPKWSVALLVMMQEAWSSRRDAHIRFLKLQVELLHAQLPDGNRVVLAPAERQRLLKLGTEINHAVEDTLAIVNIKTYRRWLREERGGREPGKVGRPRLTKSLRELILRLARENVGWGVRRIVVGGFNSETPHCVKQVASQGLFDRFLFANKTWEQGALRCTEGILPSRIVKFLPKGRPGASIRRT